MTQTLDELIRSNKVIIDSKGNPCWVYNPELFDRYIKRTELMIRSGNGDDDRI
jgi:hypothetical protein